MRIETVVIVFVLQLTFFAGVFWAITRSAIAQLRKDMTGIGEKVRQVESKLWYLAWTTCPEEKRQEVLNAMVRRLS